MSKSVLLKELPIPKFLRRAHGQRVLTRREMTDMARFLRASDETKASLLPRIDEGLKKLRLWTAPSPSGMRH